MIKAMLILFSLCYPGEWKQRLVDGKSGRSGKVGLHYEYVYEDNNGPNGKSIGYYGGPDSASGSSKDGPGGLHSDPNSIDGRYSTLTSYTYTEPYAHGGGAASPVTRAWDNGKRDDNLMNKAIDNVRDQFTEDKYNFITHNCHDFKSATDVEYKKLGGEIKP